MSIVLVGRDAEMSLLRERAGQARRGRGGALVIRGEPGIGKTALLNTVPEHADGMRVLRATGVESESRLPYAAIHQLFFPLAAEISRPELRAALGLEKGLNPDLYAVARATLEFVVDMAPVVLVLDDLHWFDEARGLRPLVFVSWRIVMRSLGTRRVALLSLIHI